MITRIAYGTLALLLLFALFAADVRIAQALAVDVRIARAPDDERPDASRWWDGHIGDLLRRGSVIPACYLVVLLAAATETRRLFCARSIHPHMGLAYVVTAALILAPWLSAAGWLGGGILPGRTHYWQAVILVAAVLGTAVSAIRRGDTSTTIRDVGATWIIILYLGVLGSLGVQLRCETGGLRWEGAWLLLITIVVTKSADIGGYFAGSFFGRHRLAPAISPGKTVEGAIGGLLMSAFVAVGFAWAGGMLNARTAHYVIDTDAHPNSVQRVVGASRGLDVLGDVTSAFARSASEWLPSPIIAALVFGLLISASGQIGDLFESSFKRDAHLKDSGSVIPSFGGILDLVDSPLTAVPVAWFLFSLVLG
ncbi:MAG: phosphatidate cytidylyltransferase [Phycisphaerae bacterium]